MAKLFDDPFQNLLAHIRPYSQRAPALLEQMLDECGQQPAFYAAFILICLQASTEVQQTKSVIEYTSADFKDFAFFTVANECALALFEELLSAYQSEHVLPASEAKNNGAT